MRKSIIFFIFIILITAILEAYFFNTWFLFFITLIIGFLALQDITQTKHSLKRNFPILARLRWVFEDQRDKIRQYFNESDTDGVPFNRNQRSLVYQRSKNEKETIPFGTQENVYAKGHEFISHSMFPSIVERKRVKVGNRFTKKPYSSSLINISAMSFGSLSGAAIRALNKGAKIGGFAHNTGEGGISSHHLQGGDLIFQIGTGYFGAGETIEGGNRIFHERMFKINSNLPNVRMIEIKLSQGAKPGHGGILPAKKNTPEIAETRGITPGTQVKSPSSHTAFTNFSEMVKFIQKLRDLSGGKPVGIKLCVTNESEIQEMFNTFKKLDNYPDFITVDGSEGGTGSAPAEFTNHIGMPMIDGLVIISKLRDYHNLNDMKIFASGKIVDAFDMARVFSLGADGVNIARGFMLSMGCIQARECNRDTCPVGIATQNKSLEKGLVVEEKYRRVENFHRNTINSFYHLLEATGLGKVENLKPECVNRRGSDGVIKNFKEIYFK